MFKWNNWQSKTKSWQATPLSGLHSQARCFKQSVLWSCDPILLKSTSQLTEYEPVAVDMMYHGQLYIQLGFAAYEQTNEPLSLSVGVVSATRPDRQHHARGYIPACPGESGGPVFDFLTGSLIGVCLGNQNYPPCNNGMRSHIIPLSTILGRFGPKLGWDLDNHGDKNHILNHRYDFYWHDCLWYPCKFR